MQRLEYLYWKYITDSLDEIERRELAELIRTADDGDLQELAGKYLDRDVPADLGHLQGHMELLLQGINRRIGHDDRTPKLNPWKYLPVAAALLAALSIGYYYWRGSQPKPEHLTSIYGDDVAPGGNRATLTLSDGTTVELADDQMAVIATENEFTYGDGTRLLTATEAVQTASLSTPRGGRYQFTLPDGSKVWLNAESSLTYPVRFSGDERRVSMTGEAYFEIAENKAKPFIVASAEQEVTVTGTAFNINAYLDGGKTMTTLVTGGVTVANPTATVRIKPGEQAVLRDGQFITHTVDTRAVKGWVGGEFVFHFQDLAEILPELERWYDIEVAIDRIPDEGFYGEISRDVPLSSVLDAIEGTSSLRFEIKGRRLMLKR